MTDTRLFFCTDLHGSEICFKKFLSAGKVYEVNTVIMGGDCTGKMVIPVIHPPNAMASSVAAGARATSSSTPRKRSPSSRPRSRTTVSTRCG